MSFLCGTLTPAAAWLTADSLHYTDGDAMMVDMAARCAVTTDANVARASAARVSTEVKVVGVGDKVVTIPGRSLAMASFDELRANLPALWRALPNELQGMPTMMVALGYSDVRSRMAGLIALSSEARAVRDLPDGHVMQPTPDPAVPGYGEIEQRWAWAAMGVEVVDFHELVAKSCAAQFPDRIGGPIRHVRLTRRASETSTLCALPAIGAAAA